MEISQKPDSRGGSCVVVGKIKGAYEEKVGKEAAEPTICRMLVRHDFHEIVPYKKHPKANEEEQETFKKLQKNCGQNLEKYRITMKNAMIMFQDKARFGRINNHHKR